MAAAAGAEHEHRLTEGDMADTRADTGDMAGHFIADDRRQVGHPFVDPRPQQHVGLADTEGMRLDQHLAGARRRIRQIDIFQNLRPARFRELYCFHVTTIVRSLSCANIRLLRSPLGGPAACQRHAGDNQRGSGDMIDVNRFAEQRNREDRGEDRDQIHV